MATTPAFVGRARELADLKDLHNRPGSHLAVIYGRRELVS